ncbi:DUF4395 domain-containing protein [Sulfuriflexus mobilis]|uniref:DUF4395 domain-containing protein n=1 Tax=Sulfuriflexus mobilis TaxID=1811807 RepID=UPI0015586174|nr:DUF4395 domain-containing protein [Sulfuriflexus mobilis]
MNTNENAINDDRFNTVPDDRWLDASEIRTGQFLVVAMVVAAYVFDRWELVAFQCGIFVLGVISPKTLDVYSWIYKGILKPLGILKPDMRIDNIEAYRFANMIGMVVSGTAAYLIYSNHATIGWGLAWMMIGLGSLAFLGWCAGCFMYYMIQKTGIKGFFGHIQVGSVFPGVRAPRP